MKTYQIIILIIIVFLLWLLIPILVNPFFENFLGTENSALTGDSFGVVNSLFSGLAFAGIIVALILQMKELKLQRDDLALTRSELSKSARSQEKMSKMQKYSAQLSAYESLLNYYVKVIEHYNTSSGVGLFKMNIKDAHYEVDFVIGQIKILLAKSDDIPV